MPYIGYTAGLNVGGRVNLVETSLSCLCMKRRSGSKLKTTISYIYIAVRLGIRFLIGVNVYIRAQ